MNKLTNLLYGVFLIVALPLFTKAQKPDTTFKQYMQWADEAFVEQKDSTLALSFYLKALNKIPSTISKEDSIVLLRGSENASKILRKKEELEQALYYSKMAYNLSKILPDDSARYRIISHTAFIYSLMKDKDLPIILNKPKKYATEELYFKIIEDPVTREDTIYAIIDGGRVEGLFETSTGKIVSGYKHGEALADYIIGKAGIDSIANLNTRIRIIPIRKGTEKIDIIKDDMAWMLCRVPNHDYKSIFWDFSIKQIEFLDMYDRPLFSLYQLYEEDSKEFEDDIYAILQKESYKTWEWLNGLEDRSTMRSIYEDTLPSGYFKGLTIFDALGQTKKEHIKAFIDFMTAFPGRYLCQSWKFSEIYATWVMNGSPIGLDTFLSILLNASSNEDYKDILERYYHEIIEKDFFISVVNKAELMPTSEKDSALKILNKALALSAFLSKKNYTGWAYFGIGHVYDNSEALDSAITYFEKSIDVFNETGNMSGKVQCINYLGYIYKEKQNYTESAKYFNISIEISVAEATKRGYYYKNDFSILANSFKGLGFAYKAIGNYDEALAAFSNSIAWNDSLYTLISKQTSLRLLTHMADIYQKRAQFDKALSIYESQLVLYNELGDKFNVALTYDDIANVQFDLGNFRTAYNMFQTAYAMKIELEKWSSAGFSMSNSGQAMWNLGKLDSSIICHNKAIELRLKENDSEGQAFSLGKMAYIYKSLGQPENAEKYYQEALNIYLALGDSVNMASVANDIGYFYLGLKNYTAAQEFYDFALRIYENRQMKSEMAEIYSRMGVLYNDLKTFSESLKYHTRALEMRRQLNERQNVMYSLVDLGFLYVQNTLKPDTALVFLNEALIIADSTNSYDYKAFCLQSMGYAYSYNGKAALAEECFKKALDVYKQADELSGQVMILRLMGDNEIVRGEFAKAFAYYNEALNMARINDFNSYKAPIFVSLTSYFYLKGEFADAFSMIDSSYRLFFDDGNMNGVAHTYISAGNTHNTIGNAREALRYYSMADSIFTTLSDPLNNATALNNMGTIFFKQGDYDNALRHFGRCQQILDSVGLKLSLEIYATSNMGEVYMERGIWDEAEKYFIKSISLAEELLETRMIWSIKSLLGKLKSKQEKYKESIQIVSECHQAFLKSDEKMAIAECATILGYNYFKLKDYQKAKEYLNSAIQIYHAIGSRKTLWEPLYYMALLEKEVNNAHGAVKLLKEAVINIEDLSNDIVGDKSQKKLFAKANNKNDIYQLLITLLVQNNNVKEAFVYQEKLNQYGLEEQTRGETSRGAKDVNNENMQASELELKKDGIYNQLILEKSKPFKERRPEKIAELEKMMTVASEDYQIFLTQLVEKEGTQQVFSNTVNPEELDQKRFDMDEDIIVLQYLVTKEQIIIFMASSDTLGAKIIDISQENTEQYVNAYYRLISGKGELKALQNASEKLYNVLIEPVAGVIKNKKKIAIVPGGVLTKLPFQSLGTMQTDGFSYLGSQYRIFYINDMGNTVVEGSLNMDNVKLLAFGNADNSLPYAEKEVNIISGMFTNPAVYLRNEALENLAKNEMNNYQIVHFATHGILDPLDFNRSYLILAPNTANNEDGLFTMNEVISLRTLRTCQLIVLSACNTAVNDEKIAGFINNPAKAFLKKGAKTTIASLWSVDDAATSELMNSFYNNLFKGQNKVEALNEAQRSLMASEKFKHPYYWAAFELIGQWK